ncbi:MAG: hypothetical protein LBF22_14305 [Deltaproteobacteria bacterium]|jgi:hypothetical protein|nr:hypothetical protein [Deltaproteobacteria bacterium]
MTKEVGQDINNHYLSIKKADPLENKNKGRQSHNLSDFTRNWLHLLIPFTKIIREKNGKREKNKVKGKKIHKI